MTYQKHIPFFRNWFIALFVGQFFLWDSCANQGVGPSGGLRDSIPPIVIKSDPQQFQTNFKGSQIDLIFNEYIVADNLNEKLVVSPPLARRPTIKSKGKLVQIKFDEELIPERTYSVDFNEGIKDYREGNILENYRLLFSTYNKLDTLRISGQLIDAYTLSPVKDATVTLYTIDDDSMFTSLRPDFVAKTNEEGHFLFDNLPPDKYRLYTLVDGDNNLFYSQESEAISFIDSLISPSAQFIPGLDTIVIGKDTIIKNGVTKFFPDSIICVSFTEENYQQFMSSYKRIDREKCQFLFNEGVTDSFKIALVNNDTIRNWNYIEYGENRDSLTLWLTDTTLIANDTLSMAVSYTKKDSLGAFVNQTDTLLMLFSEPKMPKKGKQQPRPGENEGMDNHTTAFHFSSNLVQADFDLDELIYITAPSPIDSLTHDMIKLQLIVNDSTTKPVPFTIEAAPSSRRKYIIHYNPEEATNYQLGIDSGLVHTLTGTPNMTFKSLFTTQKAEYYGAIILTVGGFNGTGILYLLKNTDKEEIVKQIPIKKGDTEISIKYIKPDNYQLKLIDDTNNDGKWDTGELKTHRRPERVYYFPQTLQIKSNWEYKEKWVIDTTKYIPKIVPKNTQGGKDGKNNKPNKENGQPDK